MILNIYKEKDWTSFDVVAKLRGVLGTKKIGHAGTLDPLAEGVLVVLTEKDTKKQDSLMSSEKEYVAEIAFGVTSNTYDLEGELVFQKIPDGFNVEVEAKKELKKYVGEIEQIVPMFSAKKVDGKPLYKKAHKGVMLSDEELPRKTVEISSIDVLDFGSTELLGNVLPKLTCKIVCSKGTYIRSIAYELGKALGIGGLLVKLTRTRVGDYSIEDSKKISELEQAKES